MSDHPTPDHYQHRIGGMLLDPYRIARLYGMADDPLFSALKKILAAGKRGAKDKAHDVQDAIDALLRWQEMRREEAGVLATPDPMTAALDAVDMLQPRIPADDQSDRIAELERELSMLKAGYDAAETDLQGAWRRIEELERERDSARVDYVQAVRERDEAWSVVRNIGPILGFREGERVVDEAARVAARIAELERERDEARKTAQDLLMESQSWQLRHREAEAERDRWRASFDRAEADLMSLRKTLEAEREDAVARSVELERVRKELADLRETYDAEMEFRAEMRRELGANVVEGFDAFLRRVCRELADLRDRYRPRKQSEEPAPEGVVLIWAPKDPGGPAGWCYATHDDAERCDTWTHQPPAPEGE